MGAMFWQRAELVNSLATELTSPNGWASSLDCLRARAICRLNDRSSGTRCD
jgi:hypothetical protein